MIEVEVNKLFTKFITICPSEYDNIMHLFKNELSECDETVCVDVDTCRRIRHDHQSEFNWRTYSPWDILSRNNCQLMIGYLVFENEPMKVHTIDKMYHDSEIMKIRLCALVEYNDWGYELNFLHLDKFLKESTRIKMILEAFMAAHHVCNEYMCNEYMCDEGICNENFTYALTNLSINYRTELIDLARKSVCQFIIIIFDPEETSCLLLLYDKIHDKICSSMGDIGYISRFMDPHKVLIKYIKTTMITELELNSLISQVNHIGIKKIMIYYVGRGIYIENMNFPGISLKSHDSPHNVKIFSNDDILNIFSRYNFEFTSIGYDCGNNLLRIREMERFYSISFPNMVVHRRNMEENYDISFLDMFNLNDKAKTTKTPKYLEDIFFNNCKGHISYCVCSPGQNTYDSGRGGLFTQIFTNVLEIPDPDSDIGSFIDSIGPIHIIIDDKVIDTVNPFYVRITKTNKRCELFKN